MVLRRFSLVFAVVMLLGLIAACGGDDDDTSADTDVTATPTNQAEAQPTTPPTEASTEAPSDAPIGTSAEVQLVEPPEMPEGIERDGRLLGNPDAAVQVVEYGDFQ
jgi:hypothetical protein